MLKFLRNTEGNIAIMSAIAIPTLLIAVGAAVDLTNAVSLKSQMQDQLDNALLAAVLEEKLGKQKRTANKVLDLNSQDGDLKHFESEERRGVRRITAVLEYDSPVYFAKILGKKHLKISVRSEVRAPVKVSMIRLNVVRAAGWFSKDIAINGTNPSGEVETLARTTYTYTRGQPSTFEVSTSDWVTVEDYDSLHLQFKIDPDSFGFPSQCWLRGCPQTDFTTKDSSFSERFFIDGVQLPSGQEVPFEKTLKCDEKVRHGWEDGGGHGVDIEYEIESKCDYIDPNTVYISR